MEPIEITEYKQPYYVGGENYKKSLKCAKKIVRRLNAKGTSLKDFEFPNTLYKTKADLAEDKILQAEPLLRGYHSTGNKRVLRKAIRLYKSAIRLDPNSTTAYTRLAIARVYRRGKWRGDIKKAVNLSRKALELEPDDPTAHLTMGLSLFYSGHLDDGIREMEQSLVLNSDSPAAKIDLGYAHLIMGNFDKSREYLEKAAKSPDLQIASDASSMLKKFDKLKTLITPIITKKV